MLVTNRSQRKEEGNIVANTHFIIYLLSALVQLASGDRSLVVLENRERKLRIVLNTL